MTMFSIRNQRSHMIMLFFVCFVIGYVVVTGVLWAVAGDGCGWHALTKRLSLLLLCPIAFAKIVAAGDLFIEKFVLHNDNLVTAKGGNLLVEILSLSLVVTWFWLYSRLAMYVHELLVQLDTSVFLLGILLLSFALYVCVSIVLMMLVVVIDAKTGSAFVSWMKWRISCGDGRR